MNSASSNTEEITSIFNTYGCHRTLVGDKDTQQDIARHLQHFLTTANNIKDDDTDLNYQYADKDELRFK